MRRYLYVLIISLAALITGCRQPDPVAPAPEVNITEGAAAPEQLEFYVSATQADEIAFICVETTDEVKVYKAEALFEEGEVFAATEEPVLHTVTGLKQGTEYTIYAAAVKDEGTAKYYSGVKELSMTTGVVPKILEFVDASKTGFSYKVNAEEGQMFYHTYLEGWFFEYNYEMNKYLAEQTGEEFDVKTFVYNLLATYGELGESAQVIDWYAGKENVGRNDLAYLVPGIKYYALAALYDEVDGLPSWTSAPEIISFTMDEPGTSEQTVNCLIKELTPTKVNIRMECDESLVNFYMYMFIPYDQYAAYVAENGTEAMKRYVSEYALDLGQAKANTYTDTWTVEPGKSYMLGLYGVDYNGDEFFTELKVDVPMPEPSLSLSMEPYEREMQGYATSNTMRVTAAFSDFHRLDYESSVMFLPAGPVTRDMFDAYAGTMGLPGTLEEMQAYGEQLYYIGSTYMGLNLVASDEEVLAQLKDRGTFEKIYTDLQPDTEYVYMVVAIYNDAVICRLASAKTDPVQAEVEESEAYRAFLGDWVVTGQNTLTYSNSDLKSFNIRFERLTSNRSYKVYGWSTSGLGQEFPFEASFVPETGKIAIRTPQVLGEVQIEGKTYEVRFVGKNYDIYSDDPDNLIVLPDHEGVAFTGKINEPYMTLLTEMFQYANDWKEYKSMSYVFYDKETREYFASEEYDLVYFQTKRAE